MPIEFRCRQCGRLLKTPDDTAGRQAQCPACGTISIVPGPAAPGPVMPGPGEPTAPPPPAPAEGSPAPVLGRADWGGGLRAGRLGDRSGVGRLGDRSSRARRSVRHALCRPYGAGVGTIAAACRQSPFGAGHCLDGRRLVAPGAERAAHRLCNRRSRGRAEFRQKPKRSRQYYRPGDLLAGLRADRHCRQHFSADSAPRR